MGREEDRSPPRALSLALSLLVRWLGGPHSPHGVPIRPSVGSAGEKPLGLHGASGACGTASDAVVGLLFCVAIQIQSHAGGTHTPLVSPPPPSPIPPPIPTQPRGPNGGGGKEGRGKERTHRGGVLPLFARCPHRREKRRAAGGPARSSLTHSLSLTLALSLSLSRLFPSQTDGGEECRRPSSRVRSSSHDGCLRISRGACISHTHTRKEGGRRGPRVESVVLGDTINDGLWFGDMLQDAWSWIQT